MRKIRGVTKTKGIDMCKLKHILLGEVNNGKVKGYHCEREEYNDTNVVIAGKRIYSSNGINRHNPGQRIFEAKVKSRYKNIYKLGGSTFFNRSWERSDVVDLIHRIHTRNAVISMQQNNVYTDTITGLVVVDCSKTTYPLSRL